MLRPRAPDTRRLWGAGQAQNPAPAASERSGVRRRLSGGAVETSYLDRVDFREPIHVGDLVIMKSSVNFVGRTSMEIGVRVETENLVTGLKRHTNSCYLTFVAVDRNGKPVPVPPLKPETPEEIRRYQAAKERRERRLQERISEGRS